LERIGPPPFDSWEKLIVYFNRLGEYEVVSDRVAQSSLIGQLTFGAPNLSLWDIYSRTRGFTQIPTLRLYREMLSTDLRSLGFEFKIPVYFFQGAEDEVTLTPLAKEYFEEINAPRKEIVFFEGAGHFAVWSKSDRFLQELVTRVRPRAVQH
jgi:pimeloyl-ACP methyl ester carboxylesterase